ncbi:MAG TPA: YkuS family protein [Oscillospiraceae bacterium]|nr:YkuS family protein [Oscillospiraceae bacterium]
MDKRVAVEDSLHEHIKFLEKSGYEVDRIKSPADANIVHDFDYDAVVVSNMDDSSMEKSIFSQSGGRASAPIVEARGKTPEEVFNILRTRH